MAINRLPLIGLGTYLLKGKQGEQTVKLALEMGYKHIDTAHVYENHKQIAQALKGYNRDALFITSKMWLNQVKDSQIEKSVEKACDKALKELNTSHLDLYLIHWPDRSRPLTAIYAAMQKLIEKGKVLSTGVSNFTIRHMQDLIDQGLTISANQVEFHPYLNQQELLNFCTQNQIKLIAYRPFGKGNLLQQEPLFTEIGAAHNKTGAQVILRWFIQKKIPTLAKASSKEHLKENIDVFDFALSDEHMHAIDALNQNKRFAVADWQDFDYQ